MTEALDTISAVCAEEGYSLELPPRKDRPNPFAAD